MYAHTETPAGSVLNMPDVLLRPHRACARTHHNRFPSPPQHSHCASRQRRALDRATQIAPGSRPAQRGTLNSARARDRHSAESATGRCRRERSSAPRHCRWPERATHAPRRSHGAFAARCAPTERFLAQLAKLHAPVKPSNRTVEGKSGNTHVVKWDSNGEPGSRDCYTVHRCGPASASALAVDVARACSVVSLTSSFPAYVSLFICTHLRSP